MTAESSASVAVDGETVAPVMLAVYRHDVHKLRGRTHGNAASEMGGVPVNEVVPLGADADAAMLSRPRGAPEQTLEAHQSPFRVSLCTGATTVSERRTLADYRSEVQDVVRIDDPDAAHRAWLDSDVPAAVSESVHYPYTSLKFHTLLTAALLSNYRAGAGFEDLALVVDDPDESPVPHRTIYHSDRVALRVTHDPEQPAASLGAAPARSWADVWSRLPTRPSRIDPDTDRVWRVLDAQLRRIRSWSTALQYLEDYCAVVDAQAGAAGNGGGGS